ncbi:MAG TPA: hypothetical protein VGC36_00365 [Rhizomicrobium sp.]
MAKSRKIEIDERTADVLEAKALARGISVSELVADLAEADEAFPPWLEKMRDEGSGPWSPEILAEDARRLDEFKRTRMGIPGEEVEAWAASLGMAHELPPPKPRKI